MDGAVNELLEQDYRGRTMEWISELQGAHERGDFILADRLINARPQKAVTTKYLSMIDSVTELQDLVKMAKDPKGRIVVNPFEEVRSVIGDFGPGSLHIIAGEPGSMKSAFVEDIDLVAGHKYKGAIFSLEMVRSVKLARYAQHMYGDSVGPRAIQTNTADMTQLAMAIERLKKLNLIIDDKPDNIVSLIDSMELMEQEQDPDYYSIDFLQLLNPLQGETDYQSVKNNMKQIYHFAKRHSKPVILLSQINRDARKDIYSYKGEKVEKLPKMGDLEGAGTIEQVAHSVMFIQPVEDQPDARRIYIAKNRSGQSPYDFGNVPVIGEQMKFGFTTTSHYRNVV